MGLLSSLSQGLVSLGSSAYDGLSSLVGSFGSSSLGSSTFDSLASLGGSAFQYQRNKDLMKYQYELNQRSLRESPLATKEGLVAAGYNPMLALNGSVNAPSVGASSVSAPDLRPDFNSAFTASKQRELMEVQKEQSVADIGLKNAQAEAARSQAVDASASAGLKAAQTLNQPSIKENTDADTTKKVVNTITDTVSPLVSAGASAYAVKKSTDLAREGIKHGLTKESAKKLAKEVTGKNPRVFSSGSAGRVLKDFGLLAMPLLFGSGVSNDVRTMKKMSASDYKRWSNIRASSYGY